MLLALADRDLHMTSTMTKETCSTAGLAQVN